MGTLYVQTIARGVGLCDQLFTSPVYLRPVKVGNVPKADVSLMVMTAIVRATTRMKIEKMMIIMPTI